MNISSTIMAVCVKEAVFAALAEAKEKPIEIGTAVGHTDFKTYGVVSGTLKSYDGDNVTVETSTGETLTWKADGIVDIRRVMTLAESNLAKLEALFSAVSVMNMMGVDPNDALQLLLPQGATKDCTCSYCTKYREEHPDEVDKPVEERKEVVANLEAVAGGGGGAENRFPFDAFLDAMRTRG